MCVFVFVFVRTFAMRVHQIDANQTSVTRMSTAVWQFSAVLFQIATKAEADSPRSRRLKVMPLSCFFFATPPSLSNSCPAENEIAASIDHTKPPMLCRRNAKGGNGGVNGHRTTAMGSSARGLGEPSAHHAAPVKTTDSGSSPAVVYNVRARESLVVAGWIFEPESEGIGMRSAAFEGPLVGFWERGTSLTSSGRTFYRI